MLTQLLFCIVTGEQNTMSNIYMAFRSEYEKLGAGPTEAIYVGDDWRIDICGAKGAGIQPVWLQHHSVSRKWPLVETPVTVITSLEQLLDLESIGVSSTYIRRGRGE